MVKKKMDTAEMNLIGLKIGDFICCEFVPIGDAVLIMDKNGKQEIYLEKSIATKPKNYKIDGKRIEKVVFSNDHSIFIFHTSDAIYFRNNSNEKFEGSENWTDYYLEPFTSSFFRKDSQGRWYDVHGFLIKSPFLINGQVLISIHGKTSKKSPFYKDQKIFTNPKYTMVQVGKVVLDFHLNFLSYMGNRITALGQKNVTIDATNSIQEVRLGFSKRGFINEITFEPLILNGEEISDHLNTQVLDNYTFHIFQGSANRYTILNDLNNVMIHENEALNVDFDTYNHIGSSPFIKVDNGQTSFYYNLDTQTPFDPFGHGELIIDIDQNPIIRGNSQLFNFTYQNKNIVYDATKKELFTLGSEKIIPEQISTVPGFENQFFYAKIEGIIKLCGLKNNEIIRLENQNFEINEILSEANQKLVNIKTVDNRSLVLDTRFGYDNLALAKVGNYNLKEALDESESLGNSILQNVLIETLGGAKNRVVNLNESELQMFHLPKELKAYSEQSNLSVFAGNIVTHIDFHNKIQIENKTFYNARFLTYLDEPKNVVIQQENARPLQLDGYGHRNELVQKFDLATLSKVYRLSSHRIVGVHTLTEDLKASQLLFSFNIMSSWLAFYDDYLPIFKKIIDFEGHQAWEYHLFELHNVSSEKEYIAVEQEAPYRILVDKTKSKYRPRIVKSKEIILKSPEEISTIRRFFSNPGYLVEVG